MAFPTDVLFSKFKIPNSKLPKAHNLLSKANFSPHFLYAIFCGIQPQQSKGLYKVLT